MENPFEIIDARLDRIEKLLENIYTNNTSEHLDTVLPPIMTVEQLASYLSLSKSTIYKLTSSRDIPFSKRSKKIYFKRKEIDKWILESKMVTNDEIAMMAADYIMKNPRKSY